MFEEGGRPAEQLTPMAGPFRTWLEPRLVDGTYFGFVVEENGVTVAGIGLMIIDWPPHPSHPVSSQRGYILNVFVEPPYRGLGIATDLMKRADSEFRKRGICYAILHSTGMGQPVYRKLGWLPTSEMAKPL